MSTRCLGFASRNAMVGTRLWPPAMTRPSSSQYSAKSSRVSSTVLGAWYWNGAGFIDGTVGPRWATLESASEHRAAATALQCSQANEGPAQAGALRVPKAITSHRQRSHHN